MQNYCTDYSIVKVTVDTRTLQHRLQLCIHAFTKAGQQKYSIAVQAVIVLTIV